MHIVYSERHRIHATERTIPEVPDRIERILAAVTDAGIGPVVPPQDFGMEPIAAVHVGGLLEHLRTGYELSRTGPRDTAPYLPHTFAVRGRRDGLADLPAAFGAWSFDTSAPLFAGTWDASLVAAQCALTAAELVRKSGQPAYALVRPPGHHAGADFYGGFCYLNHAAIAARYLQKKAKGRVAVLDIDYHHGNGTQEIFYSDPTVFFASLHADPAVDYPFYWGAEDERGEGPGVGFNCNVPLPHGTKDADYLAALEPVLDRIRQFEPKFLVLSAGFDLMAGDPVPRGGGFRITMTGLQRIAAAIAALRIPTVIVQEGGYNLDKLGDYAKTLLHEFAN